MSRLRAAWGRWASFLGEREGAEALAAARIIAGGTLAHHLVRMAVTGVAGAVWVDASHGGYRAVDEGWLALLGGATPMTVHAVLAVTAVAALLLAAGLFTRAAAVMAWFGFATLVDLNWHSGGSSDELLVNVLFLLMLSGCGGAWSLDSRLRGVAPPDGQVPAWPRRLLVLQLVLMYFTTALQKVSASWVPTGPLDALWFILQQPTWQRADMRWLAPLFPLTQLATLLTWTFELAAPLLLLAMWYRRTAGRPGRLRAWLNRIPFRTAYLALGLALHLGIWAALEVGPFLGGVLALYAACILPGEWRAIALRVASRVRRAPPAPARGSTAG